MSSKKILYLYESEVGSYTRSENKVSSLHIKNEYMKERVLDDILDVICQEVKQDGYNNVEIYIDNGDEEISGTEISDIFFKNGFTGTDGVFVKDF